MYYLVVYEPLWSSVKKGHGFSLPFMFDFVGSVFYILPFDIPCLSPLVSSLRY